MLLHAYLTSKRGNAAELARRMQVTPVMLSDWARGEKPVPPKRCVQIERLTDGAVTRSELRPADYWEYWPELVDNPGGPAVAANDTQGQGPQPEETRDAA